MKWDRHMAMMYAEEDFRRVVAPVAGIVGLATYLLYPDWVVALLAAVIASVVCFAFSLARHSRRKQKHVSPIRQLQADAFLPGFTWQERQVLEFFVREGRASVSWKYGKNSQHPFPRAGLNSLVARDLVRELLGEDGMAESFMLDSDTFATAQRVLGDVQEVEQRGGQR
jgi:hypothetical protein